MKKNGSIKVLIAIVSLAFLLIGYTPLNIHAQETSNTAEETTLKLSEKNPEENVSFQVGDLMPGDVVVQNYRIEVNFDDAVMVGFQAVVRDGYDKLAEVLKMEVQDADTGEILYKGLMRDMNPSEELLLSKGKGKQEICYKIIVSLDTSAGNEYQGKELVADFNWWTKEEERRIEITSLTEVAEGLLNTPFHTIEKIKDELNRVLISTGGYGYNVENMAFYDVRLQLWNGREWIDATEENFPIEGIRVTLPYPRGTSGETHDFTVSHMFTVDSVRLGIKAGEVEYPPVTKTAGGLQVTFKGLSPVAIAWKELETEDSSDVADSDMTAGDTSGKDAAGNATETGDGNKGLLWLMVMNISAGLIYVCGSKVRKEAKHELKK